MTFSNQRSISAALGGSRVRVISTPIWISPMLTTDKKSRDCGVRRVQARTAPCGRERLSSEITLVSSRNNESAQSKAIGGRSLKFRRGGTRSSVRASSLSSNSFRLGRALPSRSCQSSAETKTAACFPRFVTICGPSDSAFSSISLKRALASWTCQAREPPRGLCRLLIRTSHTSSQLTRQGEPYSKCAKVPSAGGGQAIDAAPDLRQPSAEANACKCARARSAPGNQRMKRP